jgi:hypothetical protein
VAGAHSSADRLIGGAVNMIPVINDTPFSVAVTVAL